MTSLFSHGESDESSSGKNIILRVLILAYASYASVSVWRDQMAYPFIYYPLLTIHEAGHFIFQSGSEMLMIAGGSITQVAVPLLVSLIFLKQRDFFTALALLWCCGISIYNVGVYASDARECNLQLVSPNIIQDEDEIMHDWNRILAHYDILHLDDKIGNALFCTASCIMLTALLAMLTLTVRPFLRSKIN